MQASRRKRDREMALIDMICEAMCTHISCENAPHALQHRHKLQCRKTQPPPAPTTPTCTQLSSAWAPSCENCSSLECSSPVTTHPSQQHRHYRRQMPERPRAASRTLAEQLQRRCEKAHFRLPGCCQTRVPPHLQAPLRMAHHQRWQGHRRRSQRGSCRCCCCLR